MRTRARPSESVAQGSNNQEREEEDVSYDVPGGQGPEEEEYEETQSEGDTEGNQMNQFVRLLRQNLNRQPQAPPRGPNNAIANAFKAFKSLKPPEFQGTADPVEARAWLKEMEKAFEIMGTEEAQKTIFATYQLKGEANYWWEAKKNLEASAIITWARFTELFLEKYFPRFMETQMELKFLGLQQDNMTVSEYEAKFTELSRFVPEYVNTDAKRARRFQQGLKQWIQNRVALLELTNYATLVQKALIVESGAEQSQKAKEGKKRKFNGPGGSSASGNFPNKFNRGMAPPPGRNSGYRNAESGSVGQGNRQAGGSNFSQPRPPLPECKSCGRRHPGICTGKGVTCFKCRQIGHYASVCPQGVVKNDAKGILTCFQCGGIGHVKKYC